MNLLTAAGRAIGAEYRAHSGEAKHGGMRMRNLAKDAKWRGVLGKSGGKWEEGGISHNRGAFGKSGTKVNICDREGGRHSFGPQGKFRFAVHRGTTRVS